MVEFIIVSCVGVIYVCLWLLIARSRFVYRYRSNQNKNQQERKSSAKPLRVLAAAGLVLLLCLPFTRPKKLAQMETDKTNSQKVAEQFLWKINANQPMQALKLFTKHGREQVEKRTLTQVKKALSQAEGVPDNSDLAGSKVVEYHKAVDLRYGLTEIKATPDGRIKNRYEMGQVIFHMILEDNHWRIESLYFQQ